MLNFWTCSFFLFLLVITFLLINSCSVKRRVQKEVTMLMNAGANDDVSFQAYDDLPKPVQVWLTRSGVMDIDKIDNVAVNQRFRLKLTPKQKEWHAADARQLFLTNTPAFLWFINLKMSPLMVVSGRDIFFNGRGELLMKLNSVFRLGKERGRKIDEGSIQRFLGEMVWFPSMALSPFVEWEQVSEKVVKARMQFNGTYGEGVFHFDENGDVVEFVAQRYKGNDKHAEKYDWVVRIHNYDTFSGVRMPSRLDATWKLDEGDWTWCEIDVVQVRYNVTQEEFLFTDR